MSPRRVLVLRGGAIGDFVLTVPLLDAVRHRWPAAHLTLVAQPRLCRLAAACGLADTEVSLDSAAVAHLYASRAADRHTLGALCDQDLAVSLLRDPDGTVRRRLSAAGCTRVLYLDPVPVTGHAADYLAGALAPLGIAPAPPCVPRLRLRGAPASPEAAYTAALQRPVVLLHPGSGSARKNWPVEHYAELAARLAAGAVATPVFVTGEADAAAAGTLSRLAPEVPRLPPCDLPQLAAEVAAAGAFVGNDAGITHLSAALDTPTVAIFGPTDPGVWAPRGRAVRVVTTPSPDAPIGSLGVLTVLESLCSILR